MNLPDVLGEAPSELPRLSGNRRLLGGIPLADTGSQPLFRDEEIEQAEIKATAHVRLFDLGVVNDLAAYIQVMQQVTEGACSIVHCERHYDASQQCMRVYLEWASLRAHPRAAGPVFSGETT